MVASGRDPMTATHATRVTNLHPHTDRRAEAQQALNTLGAAIVLIHAEEHANVTLNGCANPICRRYVAWLKVAA